MEMEYVFGCPMSSSSRGHGVVESDDSSPHSQTMWTEVGVEQQEYTGLVLAKTSADSLTSERVDVQRALKLYSCDGQRIYSHSYFIC